MTISVKPLMARLAISAALREPVCAAGTASMIALSPSGIVSALARSRRRGCSAGRQPDRDGAIAGDLGKPLVPMT